MAPTGITATGPHDCHGRGEREFGRRRYGCGPRPEQGAYPRCLV